MFGPRSILRRLISLVVATTMLSGLLAPAVARAEYGRTQGGYAGGMLGAMAGGAVGSALVAAAGIASPLVAGTLVVGASLASGFAGARVGSYAGKKWIDDEFKAKTVWTVVGGITGALIGTILGPGGTVAGKLLGAALGGVVGGMLGRWASDTAEEDFNPRTVGGLIGGLNGLLIGGPLGAVAGTTLGYLGGKVLDKHIFWDGDDDEDDGGSSSSDRPWFDEFDPDRYGDDYKDKYYDEDGNYIGGYDKQGFDRMGFDKDGFDREGFDRWGYDEDGIDRQGFDREGFKRREPGVRPSDDEDEPEDRDDPPASDDDDEDEFCFDPDIYNAWWYWYGRFGGKYPDFVDKHWDYFPKGQSRAQRIRYVAYYHGKIREAMRQGGDDIQRLKREWEDAVDELKSLVEGGANHDLRERAMRKVTHVEKELRDAVREAIARE